VTQLTGDRPENTGADRLELVVEEDCGITVKLDERAVRATNALRGANHHSGVDVTLLHATARSSVLDSDLDDVANARVAALGSTQDLDTHHRTCARIVGHVQHGLHLNHELISNLSRRSGQSWNPFGWDAPLRARCKSKGRAV